MTQDYSEARFRALVDQALTQVKKLLDTTRNPEYASEVAHKYQDKYHLADFIVKTGCAASLHALERMGLNAEGLKTLTEFAKNRSVTLRLKSEERCVFQKTVTRDVENPTKHVTEVSGLGRLASITNKVVTTVTEHLWDFHYAYEIIAFRGASPDEGAVVLQSGKGTTVILTAEKTTPKPAVLVRPSIDGDITWLLQHLSADGQADFVIDRRDSKKCLTPRRNPDVDAALTFFRAFSSWSSAAKAYFNSNVFPVQLKHGLDVGSLHANNVFVPVLPLFEATEDESNVMLPASDVNQFLAEQARSLEEKLAEVRAAFPANDTLVTAPEACFVVVCAHAGMLCQAVSDGVDYVEDLLRKGVVAAIGKVVSPDEFSAYMRFHNRRLFKDQFEPLPFCHSIRRPDHYPEGVVSIETSLSGGIMDPVPTMVRRVTDGPEMTFPLDAATRVSFRGDRYLHSMVMHQFSGQQPSQMFLNARARQFSSFIMLVGTIPSPTVFEPTAAMIVRNKDDLRIPLMLETIPTPKEFKDAIESLSPEQQRFCQAYRAMQLSSTLFGVLVLQIKPQLEKLLCLPEDSMTKEIALTQNILDLFIQYQIPSDQLKFDEDLLGNLGPAERVAVVHRQVAAMNEMLDKCKADELAEAKKVKEMAILESRASASSIIEPPMVMRSMAMSAAPPMAAMKGGPVPRRSRAAPPPMAARAMAAPAPAAAPPPPAAQPAQTQGQPQQQEQQVEKTPSPHAGGDGGSATFDVTALPGKLDKDFEKYDEDSAVRATIIKLGPSWTKQSQSTLLSPMTSSNLAAQQQKSEKKVAFDLIDALSRSGTLAFDSAELHVVVAATHCFDKSLLETVVQDNVNPIEKVERSVLIAASVVHGVPHAHLARKPLAYQPTLLTDVPADMEE